MSLSRRGTISAKHRSAASLTMLSPILTLSTSSNNSGLSSSAFTPATGEILVLKSVSEDSTMFEGTPTNTGSSITWTKRIEQTTASRVYAVIWTGTVTSGGSSTVVTLPYTGDGIGGWHSMIIERFTGAKLAATPATNTTNGSGAPSGSLTTVASGSVVSWLNGDWSAIAPGTPAYRSGAIQDGIHDKSTGRYVAYYATQAAAVIGAQTYGMTTPTGQTYSLLAIEVQAA